MFAQRDKLIELLDKNGWKLVETKKLSNHWIVEQWLIKSNWSPTDCHVFLTFEIDPQMTAAQTSKIWGVRADLNRPADCFIEYSSEFETKIDSGSDSGVGLTRIGRRWEKYLPAFFDELEALRQEFGNLRK